jgi:hypothetical protein
MCVYIYIYTKDTNDLGGATTVVRNRKNMSDTGGEILKIFNDAVESGSTRKDE